MIRRTAVSRPLGDAGAVFRTMRLHSEFAKFELVNPGFAFLNARRLSGRLHLEPVKRGLNPSLKTVADLKIVGRIGAWHATSIERGNCLNASVTDQGHRET
jgi:hypothetical protein